MNPFDDLDEDTSLLILQQLSPADLARLSCTCTAFRDLLLQRQSLWKGHCTQRWGYSLAAALHPETGIIWTLIHCYGPITHLQQLTGVVYALEEYIAPPAMMPHHCALKCSFACRDKGMQELG